MLAPSWTVNPRLGQPSQRTDSGIPKDAAPGASQGLAARLRDAARGGEDPRELLRAEKVHSGPGAGIPFPAFLPWINEQTGETPAARAAYRKMWASPQVKAALLGIIQGVQSLDLKIHPADRKKSGDQEQADYLKWNLSRRLKGGVPGLVWSVLSGGLVDGYSVCEKVWGHQDRGKYAGKWPLVALKPRMVGDDVVLELDSYGNVIGLKGFRWNSGRQFHPADFLIFRHQPLYDSPVGMSALRAAYQSYWILDTAKKLRARAAEVRTGPFPVGKYTTTSNETSLKAALAQARSQNYLVVPADVEVEVIDLAGAADGIYESLCESMAHEIFLSIQGAVLQSLEGDTTDGRGNSQVHKAQFDLRVDSLASSLVSTLLNDEDDGLIRDMVELNFAEVGEFPLATLAQVDVNEMKARLDIHKGLNDLGVPLSLQSMYEEYNTEPPDDDDPDDRLAGKQEQQAGVKEAAREPGTQAPGAFGAGDGGPDDQPGAPPAGGQPPASQPGPGGEPGWHDLKGALGEMLGGGGPPAVGSGGRTSATDPAGKLEPFAEVDPFARQSRDFVEKFAECFGETWESFAAKTAAHQIGEVWESRPNFWWTRRQDGRVVRAKAPGGAGEEAVARGHAHVQEAREKGKLSAQESHELAGKLLDLTVPQLHELKRRLGLKASGPKAELASKLATRALADAKARPKAEGARKPPRPPPAKAPAGGGEQAKAHETLKALLGNNAQGVDLGDVGAVRAALQKALAGGDDGGRGEPAGSPGSGEASPGPGRLVAEAASGPAGEGADQGRDAGRKPPGAGPAEGVPAAERVPASLPEVNKRLGRFEKFFRDKGQHHVAEWMGKLREHVNATGGEAALQALGAPAAGAGGKGEVQYWGVGTEEANWQNMGQFMEAYLARNGITAVTGDTSSPDSPLISALGKPDRYVAGQDFKPAGDAFRDKLDEAKHLPGLESSEDVSKVIGGPVTHLTDEVTAKLDEKYGKGQWIVKCYDDNAAAGYGIFFPQRAAAVAQDARNAIWNAGENLSKYGFQLGRHPDTGKVIGIVHGTGDIYQFGTPEYDEVIHGDARHWADRAAQVADHEKGAMLPPGSFMVQPAFPAVGISDADRAAGKTWHEKNEGRVHLVTRPDGKVEVIPHSTWLKGGSLPVVFEDDDTRAMAKAAQDAVNKLPPEARKGQVYAPDIMKTADGYRVVELNAQGDHNGSGYLHDNHFTIDAYTSHLTGREPAHVGFIRQLLTRRGRGPRNAAPGAADHP